MRFLLAFLLLLGDVPSAQKAANMGGKWTWDRNGEGLDLTLKQDGAVLTGYHSAVGQGGAKADEVNDGEPSIKGEVKGAVATVTFRSGFPDSTGHGTATLTLRGAFLDWRIVKSEGEHYFPKVARLRRLK